MDKYSVHEKIIVSLQKLTNCLIIFVHWLKPSRCIFIPAQIVPVAWPIWVALAEKYLVIWVAIKTYSLRLTYLRHPHIYLHSYITRSYNHQCSLHNALQWTRPDNHRHRSLLRRHIGKSHDMVCLHIHQCWFHKVRLQSHLDNHTRRSFLHQCIGNFHDMVCFRIRRYWFHNVHLQNHLDNYKCKHYLHQCMLNNHNREKLHTLFS